MSDRAWREISEQKPDFLRILKLLVDFDRQMGYDQKYEAPEGHYMRSAIAVANPQNTRIFLKELRNFVYTVVAELRSNAGVVVCTHIHEDGIGIERQSAPPDHPVQTIVCVADIYIAATPLNGLDGLNHVTRELLSEGDHPNG